MGELESAARDRCDNPWFTAELEEEPAQPLSAMNGAAQRGGFAGIGGCRRLTAHARFWRWATVLLHDAALVSACDTTAGGARGGLGGFASIERVGHGGFLCCRR
jgi:hypothetical protein